MPMYNFPPGFTNWIMGCVCSAEYSIVLNGKGDGFLKPQSGLRQGCSLSPYMFILGMDLLSRSLALKVRLGILKGVSLAPSARPITDSLYADDLLLLGSATPNEAQVLMQTVQDFAMVSGQKVGPLKSTLWFSNNTPIHIRDEITTIMGVSNTDPFVTYLGAPLRTNRQGYDFLIEKFQGRLQAWKGRLLSPAARVVLIKAVLQSLPIYYMATSKIPASVINEINSIVKRFFWGKHDKQRYLAFVAWDKIVQPIEMGGLGFRDLLTMNEALLIKFLWKLAAHTTSPWADVVRAKYMPASSLWSNNRDYRCTGFWRSLMRLRERLLPWIRWNLGNGEVCGALSQPWFEGAMQVRSQLGRQRNLTVSNLIDQNTGLWLSDLLVELFGYQNAVHILSSVPPPCQQGPNDRLMFSHTSSGTYTVKKGYALLRESTQLSQIGSKELWNWIWRRGLLLPRVRLFLWKAMHKALPLGSIMQRRFPNSDPICATCGEHPEDVSHMLHLCPFSRACSLMGPLAMRTDELTMDFQQSILSLSSHMDDEQWTDYANSLWALWRCRNDRAYSGKTLTFESYRSHFNHISWETRVGAPRGLCSILHYHNTLPPPHCIDSEYSCQVDGSWSHGWNGGMGIILLRHEELILYRSSRVQVCCSLQSEALALLQGINSAIHQQIHSCTFYTDCSTLADLCSSPCPPLQAEWTAFSETLQCWDFFQSNKLFVCLHRPRSQNREADLLAKQGRLQGWDVTGYTYPTIVLAC